MPVAKLLRPIAPWNKTSSNEKSCDKDTRPRSVLEEGKKKHFKGKVWYYLNKATGFLQWAPFPANLAGVATYETVDEEENNQTDQWIAQPLCVDVNTVVRKPGGPHLADGGDSGKKEMEHGQLAPSNDFSTLLRRRASEISGRREELTLETLPRTGPIRLGKPAIDPGMEASSNTRALAIKSKRTVENRLLSNTIEEIPASESSRPVTRRGTPDKTRDIRQDTYAWQGSFSAFASIGDFMSLRSGQPKAKVVTESAYFSPKSSIPSDMGPPPRPTTRRPDSVEFQASRSLQHGTSLPTPPIHLPPGPRHFIASATALLDKKAWRQIEALYPNAQITERDFSPPRAKSHANPHSIFADDASLAHEADVALSPSTGLIWTTLPKVRQKSLPGQAASSPIRERITHTALRYETLIVLVSQASSPDEPPLTDSDAEAFASLTAFCACVPSTSPPQVLFIPGHTSELARWTVHLMIKHSGGADVPPFELQEQESRWELWLRRAGLNAFAAQYVLGQLHPPALRREDEALDLHRGEFGLAAFVGMGRREREEAFAGVVGWGVMERVGRSLEARWRA